MSSIIWDVDQQEKVWPHDYVYNDEWEIIAGSTWILVLYKIQVSW